MKRYVTILILILSTSLFAQAQQRSSNVELFPVPLSSNQLNVQMKAATADKAETVELRNFIGKRLQTLQCDGSKKLLFSDMRQYPEGVYVILVKGKNGKIIETAKFLISKQ